MQKIKIKKNYFFYLLFLSRCGYSYHMKITDIEINDRVTFKHGDNLEFVDTGVVFHIEDDCDWVEGNRIVHVRVDEMDEVVFEVIESEILETWF